MEQILPIKIKGKPFTGTEYYHFTCQERGERYFRVNRHLRKVTQVILDSGRMKAGRGYMIGILELKLSSFDGSYYWYYGKEQHLLNIGCNPATMACMKFTTQNQFNLAFEKVKQLLNI